MSCSNSGKRNEKRARRKRGCGAYIDALERREMMAVDLMGDFIGGPSVMAIGGSTVLTVDIHNVGDAAFRGKATVDVYAVKAGQAFDISTSPLTAPHVGSTTLSLNVAQINGSQVGQVTVTLLSSLTGGSYQLWAVIDKSHAIAAETNRSNNVLSTSAFTVTQPNWDLIPSVSGTTKVPTAVVGGQSIPGKIQAIVTNGGTAALPAIPNSAFDTRVMAGIYARPVGVIGSGQDVALMPDTTTAVVAPVGKLGGGKSVSYTINVDYGKLSPGDYNIVYRVDTTGALSETNENNNERVISAAALHVTAPVVDLDITSATSTFGSTVVAGATGKGSVVLKNLGNLAASGSVDVTFYATTTGKIADGVVVGEKMYTVNVNPSSSTGTLTVPLAMPTSAQTKVYTLIAKIVPSGFGDSNAANDTQAVSGTITVMPGTVDLRIVSVSNPFGPTANPGDTGNSTVVVQNLGSTAGKGELTVTVYASTGNTITGAMVLGSTTASVSLASQASSKPITVSLSWPNPPGDGTFNLLAVVTTTAPLTDNNAANNQTAAAGTVSVKHVTSVFPIGYGDVITFKSTLDTASVQFGTFQTNRGVTGTYTFNVGSLPAQPYSVSLTFTGKSPSLFGFDLVFTGTAFKFGGHKVTFNFDPAGAAGSFKAPGTSDTAYFH